jgi:methyl-accepting chemotaxis protein
MACAAVFVLCALIAGVGSLSVAQLSGRLSAGQRSATLVRRHMAADQSHDAINGDVQSAMLAADPAVGGDIAAIRTALDGHAKDFQTDVAASKTLTTNPEILSMLAALDAPIQAYVDAAHDVVGKAGSDRAAAAAALPGFNAKFNFLATAMEAASQKIEAADAANAARGAKMAATASAIMIGALAVAVFASIALVVLSLRILVRPLQALEQAMARLAAGDTQTAIDGTSREDEIGAMARATAAFREAALAKVQMEADANALRDRNQQEQRAAEAAVLAQERGVVAGSLGKGLAALAAGDLGYRMGDDIPAEYRQLRDDFNSAIAELDSTLTVIRTNTNGISAGADEIAQASDDLSRRTEQQAASLEETAAALDEITATVKKTALSARQASDAVGGAKTEAVRSGDVVSGAVQAMGEIEQSSRQISQIIGVIDEIAFQTNLLALNAGVEAARAGDAGRGFAVVASEVRALAQRSAEAAKEIKALISASSEQVGQGVDLVGETGKALQSIVGKVAEIDALVTEIAASAQEQATGLSEVNAAVNQMDQLVQQNAAMVEESTAASHSLKSDTSELERLISRFQVSSGATGIKPAPATRRSQPAPSPAREMGRKLAATFGGGAAGSDNWEEF